MRRNVVFLLGVWRTLKKGGGSAARGSIFHQWIDAQCVRE
jgi:hypothetical protein